MNSLKITEWATFTLHGASKLFIFLKSYRILPFSLQKTPNYFKRLISQFYHLIRKPKLIPLYGQVEWNEIPLLINRTN